MASADPYAHAKAVADILTAAGVKAGMDGEGLGVPPYVVAYVDPGRPDGYPFARDRSVTVTIHTVSVGAGAEQAMKMAGKARDALLGVVPTVTGRNCQPIFWLDGQPPAANRDLDPPVFEVTAQYRFTSQP